MTEREYPSNDILEAISRCAAVMDDEAQLKDELHVLRLSSDPLAHFATSLIDLERARRGYPDARAAVPEVAESLWVFWNEGEGPELAVAHPLLEGLWKQASALLEGFELQRLEGALLDCWKARADAAHLKVAIEALLPEGNRRVEFARCLYHLELSRLLVDSSRAEFARRTGLLAEAYQDLGVASELIGGDPGLEHLWKEVVPYLDEFYEHLEEEARRRAKPTDEERPAKPSTEPDAHSRTTDPDLQLEAALSGRSMGQGASWPTTGPRDPTQLPTEKWNAPAPPAAGPSTEVATAFSDPSPHVIGERDEAFAHHPTEQPEVPREETPVEAPRAEEPPAIPVPDMEEPVLEADALGVEEVAESEVVDAGEFELVEEIDEVVAVPPPLPSQSAGQEPRPDRGTTDFWIHTFQTLEVLPGELGRSARIFACETRADRKRLSNFVDSLAPHLAVPEARAFACLIGLMVAGQTKEKGLFGQANPRRTEALAAALPYLQTTVEAAARATVWFEFDGPQTQAALATGLSLLVEYLAYCNRTQQDPLAAHTVDAFAG